MPALEQFLRTGHLGPVALGLSPNDVMIALGDPDGISGKSNPLLLKYGPIQLTFWKASKEKAHQLREIVAMYQPETEAPPDHLKFADWSPERPPTERDFRDFMHRIGYMPVHMVEGLSERQLIFPSGVTALFSDGMLHSIRLAQRETKETTPAPLSDEREPRTS